MHLPFDYSLAKSKSRCEYANFQIADSTQIKQQGQLYGFREIESYGAPDDEYSITRIY